MLSPIFLALLVVGLFLATSLKIIYEYQRAVVFPLGRFLKVKGPGLIFVVPVFQRMARMDLRTVVHEVPSQDVISRDNVSVKVDAVLYFRIVDPEKAFIQVEDYFSATSKLAQTTLRAVLGKHDLDEMLSERGKINADIQTILDAQTEAWGIKVSVVEIRNIELTEDMVRAIAKQAEAERDRRAKVIHADAEFQAAQTLVNAPAILASAPGGMQLRYLQTLSEIGTEKNSTVIFPMSIDLLTSSPPLAFATACAGRTGIPAALRMRDLVRSRFGGFLLHRGARMRHLSTGCNAVSPRQNIHRADHIGVMRVATRHALELRLRAAILSRHMAAAWAGAARVVRRHRHEPSAAPLELVVQLPAKLGPALVQDRPVQAALGPNVPARSLGRARSAARHVLHLQVLDTHHRVVLADRGRGLVQGVAPGIGDTGVKGLNPPFGLVPVLAELHLAAHRPLVPRKPHRVRPETVQWCQERAVAERGKSGNAHIDPDGAGGARDGLLDLTLGLDRDEPRAAAAGHRDVAHRAEHRAAVALAQPPQLGQEDAAVGRIELDLFRIRVAQARALAFPLEVREIGAFGEEVGVGAVQILERVLQRVDRRILEPRRLCAVAPGRQMPGHVDVADESSARLVVRLLQRQRLVEHEPARTREASHLALLLAVWPKLELERLESLHDWVNVQRIGRHFKTNKDACGIHDRHRGRR